MGTRGLTRSGRLCFWAGTGFGLGLLAPVAPGTVGSIPGLALAYAVTALPLALQLPAALGFTLLAIPVCEISERILGIQDDGRIVADEWMLLPVAVIGLPLAQLPWWTVAVFFAVIRFFDIVKLPPARRLQSIPGGRGIVADDFFANLYALGANWLLYVNFFASR